MGHYVDQHWHPIDAPGVPKRDKAGGHFRAFVPDFLMQGRRGAPLLVDDDVSYKAAVVERKILQLGRLQGATQLESIARWLMRSEAVASSKIEGIAPRVDKIALAELAQSEDVRGFKPNAAAVARNLTVLRSVEEQFEALGPITVDMLERLQEQLIGGERRIPVGVREQQNWIGGGDFTPIGAEFVPPPPEYVPELMEDLVEYLNSATHGALLNCSPLVGLRNQLPTSGEQFSLRARSSLSEHQREQLVELFEQGMGYTAAANALGVSKYAARTLRRRFQLHGKLCLVEKPTKQQYSFDIKKEVVQRYLAGETRMDLAREFGLSSDQLVKDWTRKWRRSGDDALTPKPKGRPKGSTAPKQLTEEDKLRRQIARLEAENAYLKKLRDLRNQGRA